MGASSCAAEVHGREGSKVLCREEQRILSETPQFSEGFITLSMDLYGQQIDWLSDLDVKLGSGQGPERYSDFSRSFRAMLDYAIRTEKEGNKDAIEDIFGNVRCLNRSESWAAT